MKADWFIVDLICDTSQGSLLTVWASCTRIVVDSSSSAESSAWKALMLCCESTAKHRPEKVVEMFTMSGLKTTVLEITSLSCDILSRWTDPFWVRTAMKLFDDVIFCALIPVSIHSSRLRSLRSASTLAETKTVPWLVSAAYILPPTTRLFNRGSFGSGSDFMVASGVPSGFNLRSLCASVYI